MTPKESAQQKTTMYAIIVVILFVIIIPVSVIAYVKRHKIYKARKRYCSCVLNADKDGAKVEDANGEFSHELQIKAEQNVYDNRGMNTVFRAHARLE